MVTLTKSVPEQYLITETPAERARQAVAKFREHEAHLTAFVTHMEAQK